jgi:hypothetical protein
MYNYVLMRFGYGFDIYSEVINGGDGGGSKIQQYRGYVQDRSACTSV